MDVDSQGTHGGRARRRAAVTAAALAMGVLAPLAPVAPLAGRLAAQAPVDTTTPRSNKPLFTVRDLYWAGGVAVATLAISPFDKKFADYLQGAPQTNKLAKNTADVVRTIAQPGAYIIGAGLYGVGKLAHKERLADLGLHGTEAILFGTAVTGVLKIAVGRARPCVVDSIGGTTQRDCVPGVLPEGFNKVGNPRSFQFLRGRKGGEFMSFPSGHTLVAFAAASAVTDETHRWWPHSLWYVAPVMYGGATLVGVSRMYNNKHWASDVLMGAAIGTLSGRKVVRYHHSHPENRIDKWLLGVTIAPGADGGTLVGLNIAPAPR